MTIIRKDLLIDMFKNLRKNNWNTDQDLLWGYFFLDSDASNLEKLASYLKSMGYAFVDIYPAEDSSLFWLHVERIETHDVESLDRRNHELHELAMRFNIREYDGMDVGKVED